MHDVLNAPQPSTPHAFARLMHAVVNDTLRYLGQDDWAGRRSRIFAAQHEDSLRTRASDICKILTDQGMTADKARLAALERTKLEFMAHWGVLPRSGMTDADLRAMNIGVDQSGQQPIPGTRLVALPEGWEFKVINVIRPDTVLCPGRVFNELNSPVLEFFPGPQGGSVRPIPSQQQITSSH